MTLVRTMTPVTERDWYAWHDDYDHPDTALARAITHVPVRPGIFLYLPNEAWYLPPVTDRRAPGSVLSPPPEPGWRHRVWP